MLERSFKTTLTLTLAGVLLAAGTLAQARNEYLEEKLMEADRAFAAETLEKGIDGWVGFFAEDGVRLDLHGEIVQGHEAIRKADGPFHSDPDRRLVWEPTDARAFSGSTLGFTRGTYQVEERTEDGWKAVSKGRYLSWWRRGSLGWKVILDTGSPDAPPAPTAPEEIAEPVESG